MAPSNERGTPAAQDDVLGEAATNKGTGSPSTPSRGRPGESTPRSGASEEGDAAPGVDENQAGFLHDPDKKSSP
jgi:hypothetical protein